MKTKLKAITFVALFSLFLMVGNANEFVKEVKTIESTLKLENWMVNEKTWNKSNFAFNAYLTEIEPELKVENWMIKLDSWNVNVEFGRELENKLQIEEWMLNENNWETKVKNIETALTVEPWMVDIKIWR